MSTVNPYARRVLWHGIASGLAGLMMLLSLVLLLSGNLPGEDAMLQRGLAVMAVLLFINALFLVYYIKRLLTYRETQHG